MKTGITLHVTGFEKGLVSCIPQVNNVVNRGTDNATVFHIHPLFFLKTEVEEGDVFQATYNLDNNAMVIYDKE